MTPRDLLETTGTRSPGRVIAGYRPMQLSDVSRASRQNPAVGVSDVAGELSSIVAALALRAKLAGGAGETRRYDISVQSIYFASLMLAVENDTAGIRTPRQMLAALTTVGEVVAELKDWLRDRQ